MDSISVALALLSGEMAPGIIATLESHPLLDLCGVARSVPDLLRLLDRFHPAALLISPSLLEELEFSDTGTDEASSLSGPVSFLLAHAQTEWGKDRVAGILHLPLRYGGLIAADGSGASDLFREIKRKVDMHRGGESSAAFPPQTERGLRGRACLLTVMGCKGGVGTTLLSCALASAMSSSGRRVLLMEMKRELSHILYLKPREEGKTLLDLLPLAEEISWDLIRVSVYRHAAGFHLLPYGGDQRTAMEGAVSEPLLRNLLFLFDLVIQDFPVSSLADFPPLLHHDPEVLLVSLPDAFAATCARGVASRLNGSGLGLERMRLLVNRCGPHYALSPGELATAAGIDLLATLPEDARSGLDFAELGELPHADSPLGKAAIEAAASLGFGGGRTTSVTPLHRLKRLRGRLGDRP